MKWSVKKQQQVVCCSHQCNTYLSDLCGRRLASNTMWHSSDRCCGARPQNII